ncbi:ATP-binding protein [Streptomyces sp. NPDC057052]|uniref:ATP-binding protein n=1 Tax=Streptomyces sp. NPDC057052 TaxID=3346010 RepID=UPI00362C50C8
MSNSTCPSPGGVLSGVDEPPEFVCLRETVPPGAGHVLAMAALAASASAVPRLRRLAKALAHSRRLPAAAQEALAVVVTELATNVVLHSGSADLEVMFVAGDAELTVVVRDHGRWRERPARRCEAADMGADFGRGLALVDAYSLDTSVRQSDRGTVVRAVIAV